MRSKPSFALGALLLCFFAVQLLLPLRKHLRPGDVAWSESGFRFAWHVMLAEKAGVVWFYVREVDTGRTWEVRPREKLSERQVKMMSTSPDMILQFAKYLARDFELRGHGPVEVRAESHVSLNGRPSRPLIDPKVDLVGVEEPYSVVLPGPTDPQRSVAALK